MRMDIYRNIHKNLWSIRDPTTMEVIQDAERVLVNHPQYVIDERGRQQQINGKWKTIHAWLTGFTHVDPPEYLDLGEKHQLWYDFNRPNGFIWFGTDLRADLGPGDSILMDESGAVWIGQFVNKPVLPVIP